VLLCRFLLKSSPIHYVVIMVKKIINYGAEYVIGWARRNRVVLTAQAKDFLLSNVTDLLGSLRSLLLSGHRMTISPENKRLARS
jgi:hypothetical protein